MTLYRKYRPQKIDELDSSEIRSKLTKVLLSSYTPHALLFAGPKGTGKTSTARIIAKVLNCENIIKNQSENTIEPCNKCNSCLSITLGNHLDILEIDAASNRGIEEIRDLREKIKLAPVGGKYKVYIIDEAHMLTNEAFNALLKTLEEPPPHAVFILATTQIEKIPPTIVSRCTQLMFAKARHEEIIRSLKRVALGEKINITDRALQYIAGYADGSFRDATKLLEQAISDNRLKEEEIQSITGTLAFNKNRFMTLLLAKKSGELISFIHGMGENGADFRFFVTDFLNMLHSILLANFGIQSELESDKFKITPGDISKMVKLFSRVYIELKDSPNGELPLIIAVIEWCEEK